MFDKIKDILGGGGDVDLGSLPLGGYEKYLEGVTYPIGIDDLMTALKNNGAPSQLLDVVKGLGGKGKTSFASQEDVVDSVKGELKTMM
jgi:hypothetical protein